MSAQSDAAKAHIEKLFEEAYPPAKTGWSYPWNDEHHLGEQWQKEYQFAKPRRWAFDYAVPAILCANPEHFSNHFDTPHSLLRGVIEIDGGTFQSKRTGHSSGVGLRGWREKNNAAMTAGWRVWHYAPEEIIKAGRKCS